MVSGVPCFVPSTTTQSCRLPMRRSTPLLPAGIAATYGPECSFRARDRSIRVQVEEFVFDALTFPSLETAES
jgi:hypothetical protein